MTHPNREIPRPTCHGEEEPAVLASADQRREMYRFLSEEAPSDAPLRPARPPSPVDGSTWWQSLSPAERAAAIRRAF